MDLLRFVSKGALVVFVVAAASGCRPELDRRPSELGAPIRVLAVRAEPAEGEPRDEVTFRALVVDEAGNELSSVATDWAFCTARKPLAELGPVSRACYTRNTRPGTDFVSIGQGLSAKGTLPTDACRNFGPEVPTAKPGEPYGRPVDADPTGGYYQPVTFVAGGGADDVVSVETTRISCGVSGASSDDVVGYRQRYHANENPEVASILVDGTPASDAPLAVDRGQRLHLRVTWAECPDVDVCGDGVCGPDETRSSCVADCGKPQGCRGAERYVAYDAEARALTVRREAMRASWFASAGSFDFDRSGTEGADLTSFTENDWTAPGTPGPVRLWVVLRDERGGTGFRGLSIDVR